VEVLSVNAKGTESWEGCIGTPSLHLSHSIREHDRPTTTARHSHVSHRSTPVVAC
jgi:hypothetical protein